MRTFGPTSTKLIEAGFFGSWSTGLGTAGVIRLISKWLSAGVMKEGEWRDNLRGIPQGSIVSPVLANVYLHYVLDLWFQRTWRARTARGDTIIVRYADDLWSGSSTSGTRNSFCAI